MIQVRIRKAGRPGVDVEVACNAGLSVVFGPRDAGKTLMLDCIAGLAKPDEGRILLDDQILFDGATRVDLPPMSRPVGYVPRGAVLFPHMTIRENLLFAGVCRRLGRLERHRRASELTERFRLTECSGRRPSEVAESDRLGAVVARALVGQPKLLLVDDPTEGLDPSPRAEFLRLLHGVWAESGIAVLATTRFLEDCFELGVQMLVLAGGRLMQTGPPREVIDRPANIEVARALGGFNLLSAQIVALDPGRGTSKVRLRETDLAGPYFPGKLKGDQVTLCVRPLELVAQPAFGKPGANQVPVQLGRVTELVQSVRLHFDGGIAVEMGRADFDQRKHHREWFVEFPAERLRVV